MPIRPGSYTLGPAQATLTVHTARTGPAARAGHDLRLEVTAWSAELQIGEDPAASDIRLTADSSSLEVRAGTGGLRTLGDEERAAIKQTIDDTVLRRGTVEFRSTRVEPSADGSTLRVDGELALRGERRPLAFELHVTDDGQLTASATVVQTDFGITPYATRFGAMKVVDEVQVSLDGRLPAG